MAVVESEKIAKQPEDAPYHGARVQPADAGLKITSVEAPSPTGRCARRPRTRSGRTARRRRAAAPADARAGRRSAEGRHHPRHRRQAREHQQRTRARVPQAQGRRCEVAFSIVRERKDHEISVTFGKYPKGASLAVHRHARRPGRRLARTCREPNGHEYGGVYKSTDGGDSVDANQLAQPAPDVLQPDPHRPEQQRQHHGVGHVALPLGPTAARASIATPAAACTSITTPSGSIRERRQPHHPRLRRRHLRHLRRRQALGPPQPRRDRAVLSRRRQPDRNYRVYGGLQDNGSWGGPSRTAGTGARNHDWVRVGGGDGFRCLVDPDDKNVVYSQSQNGPRRLAQPGEQRARQPAQPAVAAGAATTARANASRFNWETPYLLSGHNSRIVYTAGNKVFKSLNRGRGMKRDLAEHHQHRSRRGDGAGRVAKRRRPSSTSAPTTGRCGSRAMAARTGSTALPPDPLVIRPSSLSSPRKRSFAVRPTRRRGLRSTTSRAGRSASWCRDRAGSASWSRPATRASAPT